MVENMIVRLVNFALQPGLEIQFEVVMYTGLTCGLNVWVGHSGKKRRAPDLKVFPIMRAGLL